MGLGKSSKTYVTLSQYNYLHTKFSHANTMSYMRIYLNIKIQNDFQ